MQVKLAPDARITGIPYIIEVVYDVIEEI